MKHDKLVSIRRGNPGLPDGLLALVEVPFAQEGSPTPYDSILQQEHFLTVLVETGRAVWPAVEGCYVTCGDVAGGFVFGLHESSDALLMLCGLRVKGEPSCWGMMHAGALELRSLVRGEFPFLPKFEPLMEEPKSADWLVMLSTPTMSHYATEEAAFKVMVGALGRALRGMVEVETPG